MSASMTRKISAYHDKLVLAVDRLHGQEVTQAEVRTAYATTFPELEGDLQWLMAADHCLNHTNKGACQCSRTTGAVFERLGRDRYMVLRRNGQA